MGLLKFKGVLGPFGKGTRGVFIPFPFKGVHEVMFALGVVGCTPRSAFTGLHCFNNYEAWCYFCWFEEEVVSSYLN